MFRKTRKSERVFTREHIAFENMRKILSVVKQREVEYPEKLVYRSPFWYRVGLWKVDYSKKENSEL